MNELKIFENEQFGEVRTSLVNDEPYFMLSDICRVLEIGNSRQAKTRLTENGVINNDVIDSMGRTQKADFINESNLYKLVFQSRKPQAIRDRVNSGKLKPLKNLPANRFSVSYIEEIEQSQCDPLSPVEKRRLLNKIEGLEKELEYSKNVLISISNLVTMKGD